MSSAGGRRAGSDNAAKVSSVPGANAAAVSTVRPLDTSPRRTCAQAASRRRRLAASSSAWAGAGPSWSAASRAAANRAVQRPARKSRTRWSSASRPVEPVTRTRKRSRRGTSDYSRKSSKLGFVVLRRLASVHLQVDGIELCPCGCRDAGRGCIAECSESAGAAAALRAGAGRSAASSSAGDSARRGLCTRLQVAAEPAAQPRKWRLLLAVQRRQARRRAGELR